MAAIDGLDDLRVHSGKVRDLYAAGDGRLLMVASDRISAFDYILPTEIPDKGAVLTAMSLWWFEQLADMVPNHVVTARVEDYPAEFAPFADALRGRSVLCRQLDMVAGRVRRARLSRRQRRHRLRGERLGLRRGAAAGLLDGSRLPEPIFTPTTKAPVGEHDKAMTFDEVVAEVGAEAAEELRSVTLAVYSRGRDLAERAGIILADTKFEFGRDQAGELVLGDEVLTPDSSRFWPADTWKPGGPQPSYDKQYVRDWVAHESGWDRSGPAAWPARRRGRAHPREVRRGLRAAHRPAASPPTSRARER